MEMASNCMPPRDAINTQHLLYYYYYYLCIWRWQMATLKTDAHTSSEPTELIIRVESSIQRFHGYESKIAVQFYLIEIIRIG